MGFTGVDQEKTDTLSVILEGLLYGVSLPMFGWTIWALWCQRSTHQVNLKMCIIACLLLLLSTVHLVIHSIRIMEGVMSSLETHTGGYHWVVPRWTFTSIHYLYTAQTLIGDGVVLYRCYIAWQSRLIMVLPAILWCSIVVTGIAAPYMDSHSGKWLTAFWGSTLSTNLLTTLLLVGRIWYVNRKAKRLHGPRRSQLQPMLYIIVDTGVIYTLTLVLTLICFLSGFNFQYAMQDMAIPIISITFYAVIIRVGLANRANKASNFLSLGNTIISNSMDQRNRMKVHVTTYTENNVENCQRSAASPILVGDENNLRSEIKFDEGGDGV